MRSTLNQYFALRCSKYFCNNICQFQTLGGRNQTKVLARKYVHFQSQVAAGKGTRLVAARPAAYLGNKAARAELRRARRKPSQEFCGKRPMAAALQPSKARSPMRPITNFAESTRLLLPPRTSWTKNEPSLGSCMLRDSAFLNCHGMYFALPAAACLTPGRP